MKRAAIFVLAAFYLLLSTGTYVCAMHCAAADVLQPKVTDCCHKMGAMPMAKQEHKGHSDGCAKKHGNFIVKENLMPSFSFKAAHAIVLVADRFLEKYKADYSVPTLSQIRYFSKAPPPIAGRAYLIQIRTLLI